MTSDSPGDSILERLPLSTPAPPSVPSGPEENKPPADLHAHLASHVEAERGMLEEYEAALESVPSRAFQYLMTLLIEDEKRHHRVFTELVDSLKVEESHSERDPSIPHLDFSRLDATEHAAVVALTEELLDREKDDARELKRLRRELRNVDDAGLWSLLVDLMERDTRKHIAILRFARKQARAQHH